MESQAPELEFFQEVKRMKEEKIAERLTELRKEKGVTQEEVAKGLSISGKTLSKWENGSAKPDVTMLGKLAGYYRVTADWLLGLEDEKKQSTEEEIRATFEGLGRREAMLKAFETVRALLPVIYEKAPEERRDGEREEIIPKENPRGGRSYLSVPEFFEFTVSTEKLNAAVMMMKNKADFAWMKNPETQKKTVKIFRFLSEEDALSVLYFLHSESCSECFTADYIAENTGVGEARVAEILDEFCKVGDCWSRVAHLAKGDVKM